MGNIRRVERSPGKTLRQRVAKGALWSGANGVGVAVLELAQVAILASLVGPSAYGLMSGVLVIIGLSRIVSKLGFAQSLIFYKEVSAEEAAAVFWLACASGCFIAGLCYTFAHALASFLELPIAQLLRVASIMLIFDAVGSHADGLLRKQLRFKGIALIDVGALAAGSAVGIVHAGVFEGGAWALVWAYNTRSVLRAIALFGIAQGNELLSVRKCDWSRATRHLSFGSYRAGSMVANYLASRVDQIIVAKALGPVALGLYNLAFQASRLPISKVTPVINNVAMPAFALAQDTIESVRRGYLDMVQLLSIVVAPLCIGGFVLAPFIVPGLLGQEWVEAVPIVQILAIFSLFTSLGNASGALIWGMGHARWSFWWNVGSLVVKPPIVIVGALVGGMRGVAAAMVAVAIITCVLNYWMRVRQIVGPVGYELVSAFGRPVIWSAFMGGIVWLVSDWIGNVGNMSSFVGIGLVIGVGAILYGVMVWCFERRIVRQVIKAVSGGISGSSHASGI